MIKYLGSKRKLIPALLGFLEGRGPLNSALDVFSGTARVGYALKDAGLRVTANDHNAYAYALACCYVEADRLALRSKAEKLIAELNRIPGKPGFFTQTYCERSRFFQPKNGERIDAIRERIEQIDPDLDPILRAVLLVSLMEAADRVDSTVGVQMAFLKEWSPRSYKRIEMRVPDMLPGSGLAVNMDAQRFLVDHTADLVYIDPPYNQHSYLGNYHIWESLVRWDKPEVYGVACKRVDCQTRKSPFNSKRKIHDAIEKMVKVLSHHPTPQTVVVSFNNEGFVSKDEMLTMLRPLGHVDLHEVDHKRYVGAQIGIHDRAGRKVGKVSHTKNIEYFFLVQRGES